MKIKALALLVALGVFGFAGAFISAALRPTPPDTGSGEVGEPTAAVSEAISDGRLDMQVYLLGNLDVRLEIQFAPGAASAASAGMRPEVNLAMLDMHMDGIEPPLQLVSPGQWRARLNVPMAGRWVASAGFGEERAEVEFDAR